MATEEQAEARGDRREFFRIDDSIQVSYRAIDADELHPLLETLERGGNGNFTIMTRMQAISQHLAASLHRIEQCDPDVADYLKALDEKITLLGQSLLAQESEMITRQVNLSAGGLALDSVETLEVGRQVEIKLLMLPSCTGVLAYGEVVGVTESAENSEYAYRLRINFTHIRDLDRDALIRHILRRQGQMLRNEREIKKLAGDS